ncbi:hypothetical protein M8J77_000468 [Diaphorina citri]|nr:hypothetical protein M8J77_000468 [Diaphorina citri]
MTLPSGSEVLEVYCRETTSVPFFLSNVLHVVRMEDGIQNASVEFCLSEAPKKLGPNIRISFAHLLAEDVSVNVPHTAYRRLESGHGKTYLATSKQDMRDACTITVTDRTINFADQRVIHFSQEDGHLDNLFMLKKSMSQFEHELLVFVVHTCIFLAALEPP